MKLYKIFIIGFALAGFGITSEGFAQNKLESWYTYWGLGYANVTYPSPLDAAIDQLKDTPGVDHVSISLDVLGFYWPKGERTLIGAVVNGFGDRFEAGNEHMQINGLLLSFSAMRFLTDRIGKGLLLRGDVGAARIGLDTSVAGDATSDLGWGASIGAGYGLCQLAVVPDYYSMLSMLSNKLKATTIGIWRFLWADYSNL